jgi:2-polyprenyl-3-methyl-5-hydroxy-6-metoxy-1,4-benzoquinol methylase
MKSNSKAELRDTGERIIPTAEKEVSFVFERHKFAYTYALNFVDNKKVLDVGCGTGYGCKILSQRAKMIWGIDYDEEAIAYCKKFYSGENIFYAQMDNNCLGFQNHFKQFA